MLSVPNFIALKPSFLHYQKYKKIPRAYLKSLSAFVKTTFTHSLWGTTFLPNFNLCQHKATGLTSHLLLHPLPHITPMTGHRHWGSSTESHAHACILLFPLCRIMFSDSEIMKHDTRLEQILQHLSEWIMKRGFDSSLPAAALTPAWCHLLSWKRSSFALG